MKGRIGDRLRVADDSERGLLSLRERIEVRVKLLLRFRGRSAVAHPMLVRVPINH
jgi:hypothetical protein